MIPLSLCGTALAPRGMFLSTGKAAGAEPPPCLAPASTLVEQGRSKVSIPLQGSPTPQRSLVPKQKNSAAKQNCCLTCFFSLKREAGRNIKINPLPPQILPLSRSIKNILELRPCLCSSALEEDFCQDTDPLWILQMSLNLFFFSSRGKGKKKTQNPFKPSLGPLQSRAIRRFIIKRRLRGDLWNYS